MKYFFTVALVLFLLMYGTAAATTPSFSQIDQNTAMEMMTRDDGHIIIDVRRQEEYDSGHIPGAILIPNETIGMDPPEALTDYDQIILVYCRSGNRSKQAAHKLAEIGYSNVFEFGGILTWKGDIVTSEEMEGKSATLHFSSFDGGGYEYNTEITDPTIISCTSRREYGRRDELETGSAYTEIITLTGLKPGSTRVMVCGRSPIMENDDFIYTATVDEKLNVTLESERRISTFFLTRNGDIKYDTYNISWCKDGYYLSINDEGGRYIDTDFADSLMQIFDEYDLSQWDGFDKSNQYVLDGEGFWLEIRLTDGTTVSARGENAFPRNYYQVMDRMQEILEKCP